MSNINKDEAILWFSREIGSVDGEWSKEEIQDTIAFGNLDSNNLDIKEFYRKIENGIINSQVAIDFLLSLDYKDKLDCIVTCYAVAVSDSNLTEEEKKYLVSLLLILEIEFDEVLNKYNRNFLNNQHIKNNLKSESIKQKPNDVDYINLWFNSNKDKFSIDQITIVSNLLNKVKPEKAITINTIKLVDPNQIMLFSWLFGIDRFFLGQIGLGLIKLLTYFIFGLGLIWWFIDALSSKKRAYEYNFIIFQDAITKL